MSRNTQFCSTTNTSLRKRRIAYNSSGVSSVKVLQVHVVISILVFISPQAAQEFSQFLFAYIFSGLVELCSGYFGGQIFLRREISIVAMAIFISFPIVQVLHQLRGGITDMDGDRQIAGLTYRLFRGADCRCGGIALG